MSDNRRPIRIPILIPILIPVRSMRHCDTFNNDGTESRKGLQLAFQIDMKQYQYVFCCRCGDYIDIVESSDESTHSKHTLISKVLCKCPVDSNGYFGFRDI